MPDEQKDDSDLEADMLKLMSQESGDEALPASSDAEAGLLQMFQDDQAAAVPGAPTQDDVNTILEREMRNALQDSGPAGAPSPGPSQGVPASSVFTTGLGIPSENVGRLLGVRLWVSIELGRVDIPIKNIMSWTEGSLIELDKVAGDAVDILVNEKRFAQGEVVTIAENFGVRISQMQEPEGPG